MLPSIEEIQQIVTQLGRVIDAPSFLLFVSPEPVGDGTPHLEVVNGKFDYVVTERGVEFSRKTTESVDELLYWIMKGVVSKMAMEFELNNRVHGQDSRRLYFSTMIDLLGRLRPSWRGKIKEEIEVILEGSPYVDT
jgi:hypothetical protein